MKIEYPEGFDLEGLNNDFLWRYVGISKLLYILNNNQIYFTRFDHFEDALEGITKHALHLKLFTQGEPWTHENLNPLINYHDREKIILDDKNRRIKYKEIISNSQQTQYASCWFFGKKESLAMWKLYSASGGIAIRFDAKELIQSIIRTAESYIGSDFEILYFGKVDYKNIWPFDLQEKYEGRFNGLKKDKSYSHENEFRFIVVVSIKNKAKHYNFSLPIGDLSQYNFQIITNPFMADWEIVNLKKLLEKYNLSDKLRVSEMDIRK